ncbi:MAG: GNAT family N-acetyltransferase [Anaerolineae bacterium]|nr:GNAT family N-acetyltransferase [Anaerolineae bacterium]
MQKDNHLKIRQAQIEDSMGLARVQVDSYRITYKGILAPSYLEHFTYEEQEQDWHDLLASDMQDVLYIAETAIGEIAGYALGRPGISEVVPYDSELVALHVRRSFQRQGIGRQLFKVIAEVLRQRGCTSLMLWVLEENPSRRFYEQMGGCLLDARQASQGAIEVAYGWSAIESLCE